MAKSKHPQIREEGGVATATKTKPKLQRPKLFKVLLHNDDFTTMEFVVEVLRTVFNHNENDAMAIMLKVHHDGIGIAGVYTFEIAETKAARVMQLAREEGFPLMCSLEPDEGTGPEE